MALTIGIVDSQELSTVLSVPDSNIVLRAGSEDVRVIPKKMSKLDINMKVLWETDIVDSVWMGSVPDLSVEAIGTDPVDIGLISSSEEVSEVLCESQGGDSSPDFGPILDLHGLD